MNPGNSDASIALDSCFSKMTLHDAEKMAMSDDVSEILRKALRSYQNRAAVPMINSCVDEVKPTVTP